MRHVVAITDQELQRMWSRGQFDDSLCLTLPEVDVVFACGDRQVHRWQLGIDQQMMVSGLWLVRSGRRNIEPLKTQLNHYRR